MEPVVVAAADQPGAGDLDVPAVPREAVLVARAVDELVGLADQRRGRHHPGVAVRPGELVVGVERVVVADRRGEVADRRAAQRVRCGVRRASGRRGARSASVSMVPRLTAAPRSGRPRAGTRAAAARRTPRWSGPVRPVRGASRRTSASTSAWPTPSGQTNSTNEVRCSGPAPASASTSRTARVRRLRLGAQVALVQRLLGLHVERREAGHVEGPPGQHAGGVGERVVAGPAGVDGGQRVPRRGDLERDQGVGVGQARHQDAAGPGEDAGATETVLPLPVGPAVDVAGGRGASSRRSSPPRRGSDPARAGARRRGPGTTRTAPRSRPGATTAPVSSTGRIVGSTTWPSWSSVVTVVASRPSRNDSTTTVDAGPAAPVEATPAGRWWREALVRGSVIGLPRWVRAGRPRRPGSRAW